MKYWNKTIKLWRNELSGFIMYVFFWAKRVLYKASRATFQPCKIQRSKSTYSLHRTSTILLRIFLITGVECTSIALAKSVRSTGNLGLKTRGSRLNFAGKYRKWRRSIWKSWWSKLHYLASFFRFWEKIWTKFGRKVYFKDWKFQWISAEVSSKASEVSENSQRASLDRD